VIANTSPFAFTSLSVTDDQGVDVACPRELPQPGESVTCTGSGTAVAGQYHNVGSVTATARGKVYVDRDESFYFGVPVGRGVTIQKLTNGQRVSQAPGPGLPVGGLVSWVRGHGVSPFPFTSLSVTTIRASIVPRVAAAGGSIRCTGAGRSWRAHHRVGMVTATGGGTSRIGMSFYFGARGSRRPIRKFTNGERVSQCRALDSRRQPRVLTYVVTNVPRR
jgi:hypothetical protein